MWAVTAEILVFLEALEWFRSRTVMSEEDWQELAFEARVSAQKYSAVAQADLINDVFKALAAAIAKGTTLKVFQAAIGEKLVAMWAGTEKAPALRIEKIFRTNIQRAYNAGRFKQMSKPTIRKARPYWMFDAVMDNRTSPICEKLNGVIILASDPWWDTHYPPMHFWCRSSVRALRAKNAKLRGITKKVPSIAADTGFGKAPKGSDWQPDLGKYPTEVGDQLKLRLP